MGKFTDRIRAAVESTKQVLPVAAGTASGMPPARGGSTASLASLDLTDAACSIREALEAGQPGPAAKMAGTRNRASDIQKGYTDPGGPFGASSASDMQILFGLGGEVFPPGLTTKDRRDVLISVGLEMLWCASGPKNTEGVLLGADVEAMFSWSEIELERSLGLEELDFELPDGLETWGLARLSVEARQLLAQSGSKGERAAKEHDLLRRQVCLNPERFAAALAELEAAGLAGTGDFAATMSSYTAAQLVQIAELMGKKIPKSGRKARQVEVLLGGEDAARVREFAIEVDASRLANQWWIVLPQCREVAAAKALGSVVHGFVMARAMCASSAGNGAWTWEAWDGCCSMCRKLKGKHARGDRLPKAHLSCRCSCSPVF